MPDLRELFDALASESEVRGADAVWEGAQRRPRRHAWWIAAAIVVVGGIGAVVAFVARDDGAGPVELVDTPRETATSTSAVLSDSGMLLVWSPEDASRDTELALLHGTVTFDEQGCVLLGDRLVIWPAGTTWALDEKEIRLPSGAVVRAGDLVSGAGGYHPNGTSLPVPVPAVCSQSGVAVFGSMVEIAVTRADGTVDFTRGYGMAFAPDGAPTVADASSRKVWKRDGAGTWVSLPVAGGGFLADPRGIAYDGAGNLYVADASAGRVQLIAPAGTARVVAENLLDPVGVAFDPRDGSVLVAEGGADRIGRIDASGAVTTLAEGHENVCSPISIAIAADGSVWFGELCDKDVRRIGPDGSITTVEGVAFGSALTPARDGGMYVANGRSGEIWHVALDGTITSVLASDRANVAHNECAARGYSGTSEAIAMADTDDGLVFVDSGSGRLCVLSGDRITEF